MIHVKSAHPPVCVVVPSPGNLARYTAFEMSLEGLLAPQGSFVARVRGSSSLALGVNAAVKMVLESPQTANVGRFFFVDDDHEFDQHVLVRLLETMDASQRATDEEYRIRVLMALCMRKEPPFDLMAFSASVDDHKVGFKTKFVNLMVDQIAALHGPYPVKHVGRGGLLVDSLVFQRIQPPWFQVGQIDPEEFQEDMHFSDLCRAHGFQPYVHLDVVTGHTEPVSVFPHRLEDGTVVPMLRWGNGKSIVMRGLKP